TAVLAGGVDQHEPLLDEMLRELGAGPGVPGEGATLLLLEAEGAARRRGARILGEITGAASGALPVRPHGVGRAAGSRAIQPARARAGLGPSAIGWAYALAGDDAARAAWEARTRAAALAPHRPPCAAPARRLGAHAGSAALAVAAAAWTARMGRLPALDGPPVDVARGPGLVHGLARGGSEVALVVGPAPAEA